jgi:site-specific DNA-adenine methylase
MKSPFPYFGGKSRAASLIWSAFGTPKNYIEPFAGSLAVLLANPQWENCIETVNDKDCYIANFWRSMASDSEAVFHYANWPSNEADLHARHQWLVSQSEFREKILSDPEYFDTKIAGWWVWGIAGWIGSGWCDITKMNKLSRKLIHLGDAGRGLHCLSMKDNIEQYFKALGKRLRRVRVACGEWDRILSPACTFRHGVTAVLLDPPYSFEMRQTDLYSQDNDISTEVREWAIANGENPLLRIALCGYEGEHELPKTWSKQTWTARSGYARNKNHKLETIWFSPHCLHVETQTSLFNFCQ